MFTAIDNAICQKGGVSARMRTGMVIGAMNGAIVAQNDTVEFGSRMTAKQK